MRVLICAAVLWSGVTAGKQIEDVDLPDQITVGAETLVLNGAGVRSVKRYGFKFKVYVAGLWVKEKSADAAAIINSSSTKVIEMVFLRTLDKGTLQKAWTESYGQNCKPNCDEAKLKELNDLTPDVKDKSRLKIIFDKTGIAVEGGGKAGRIEGEAFRKGMMAVFIGEKPPTEEFKQALLGK